MQKNIIYIFGNNSALIEEDKNNLVRIFREKYGTESVEIHLVMAKIFKYITTKS